MLISKDKNMRSYLKKLVRNSLNLFNLEIIGKKNLQELNNRLSRLTMEGCLIQAAQNGLKPNTIIDVGAGNGTNPGTTTTSVGTFTTLLLS